MAIEKDQNLAVLFDVEIGGVQFHSKARLYSGSDKIIVYPLPEEDAMKFIFIKGKREIAKKIPLSKMRRECWDIQLLCREVKKEWEDQEKNKKREATIGGKTVNTPFLGVKK